MDSAMEAVRPFGDAKEVRTRTAGIVHQLCRKVKMLLNSEQERLAQLFQAGNVVICCATGKAYRVEESDYVGAMLSDLTGQVCHIEWFDYRLIRPFKDYSSRWELAGAATHKLFAIADELHMENSAIPS